MTKPIEWTTTENMPVIFWHRMHVDESGELRDATPSDLSAALAAMGEGERAEVLAAFHGDSIVHRHLQERVEDAERERDRMAREFGTRPGELPDDGEIARVVRERAEFRARAEAAEWERVKTCLDLERARASLDVVRHDLAGTRAELQEAREARDRSTRLRDAMMPDTRAALDAEQYEDAITAARRVVAERNRAQEERDKALAEQERLLQSNARYSRAADEALRDRDLALGERNRAQAERDTERACRLENEAELHRANKELGDLRTRLIAALKAERDDARLRCGAALATAATATARAEKAERERDELGAQLSAAELQYTHQGLLLEQARERAAERANNEAANISSTLVDQLFEVRALVNAAPEELATAAVRRLVSELDATRGGRAERAEWVAEMRSIIRALPTESIEDAARRVVRERDEARDKLAVRGVTADAFRSATDRADAAGRAERIAREEKR